MNTTNTNPRKTNTTIPILAAVAFGVVLCLGVYFLYGRQFTEADIVEIVTPTSAPAATSAPGNTSAPNPTAGPTQAPAATATTAPPAATATPASESINVYMIALGDNGANGPVVGCGDSVVFATRTIPPQSSVEARIGAALTDLFSIRDQTYEGFYNALYQSQLTVDSVTLAAGVAVVNLSGTVVYGDDCDRTRVEGQIRETILQFPEVNTAQVFVNGVPLEVAGG